jgi:hypothetical protein
MLHRSDFTAVEGNPDATGTTQSAKLEINVVRTKKWRRD